MIRWREVIRTVIRAASILVALLAGAVVEPAAVQLAGGIPRRDNAPFPPPPFLRSHFEPRVEGLPFRAVSEIELAEKGSDGNLSTRRTTGLVARDATGRTRHEDVMGPEESRVVAIDDPVANVRYVLFPDREEGRKLTKRLPERMRAPFPGRPGADGAPEVSTQSLGTQVIAGIDAEGTLETITLPAGARGNDSPVEMVSERWYSKELKTVVRHRHRGPRGERTWTLTEITRGEPEATLFEVPAGIEIEEGIR